MDKLPDNHIVKQIHMNFQSIGCGNTGNQWCTAGADDTVTNTVTLTSTDTDGLLVIQRLYLTKMDGVIILLRKKF